MNKHIITPNTYLQSLNTQTTLTHLLCKKPPRLCVLLLVGPPGLINIVNWYLADKRQQRPEERTPGAERESSEEVRRKWQRSGVWEPVYSSIRLCMCAGLFGWMGVCRSKYSGSHRLVCSFAFP